MNYLHIVNSITGVSSDSRNIRPGFAFVAINGGLHNGHLYINNALQNGASYIIYDQEISDIKENFIKVDNSREALAILASEFYQSQPKNLVAVTGTNGKSSTVSFFSQIIALCGYKAASIGTIGISGFSSSIINDNTTPEPTILYKMLSEASEQKIEYLALEASSHGLKQHRLDGIKLKAAGFTNFTQDHLDYHQNMEDYFSCKMLLFSQILKSGYVVINADIPEFEKIKNICSTSNHKLIDYGYKAKKIKLLKIEKSVNNQSFVFEYQGNTYASCVNLVGDFQLYNMLCAIGLVLSCEIKIDDVIAALPHIKCVSGRMEKINIEDKDIYIDYAHTPDALEKALISLRPHVQNKLLVLFGCGGDRDKQKRPLMGEIASKYADIVIITDDNPRNEEPEVIRNEILAKCKNATEIAGREKAINHAISIMKQGDILLIAGKGHENYQIIGKQKNYFSDKEVVEYYDHKLN